MPNASETLLALVTKSAHGGALLPKLPLKIRTELAAIHRLESQAASRAVRLGLWLWQAKAALKHGEFQPWIKSHVEGVGYRQCAYYMKLALTFAEKSKLDDRGLAALCAHDFDDATLDSSALETLAKFVGDYSLTELLIKHGIKGVGLKSELTTGDAPPELTPGEQMELVWEQAYQPAKSLADLLVERAAGLAPDRREAIAAELTRALQALRAC